MRHISTIVVAFLTPFLGVVPAFASATDWLEVNGGRVRLVTSGLPDSSGLLNGALEIDLEPGWKTYWRDPGDAGVPPQIDIARSSNIASAELRFPPPERFDDGYTKWAGYKHLVTFPVSFRAKTPDKPVLIDADVFLGICETICIPVQGSFTLDPAADPDHPEHAALIKAANEALAHPAKPNFSARVHTSDDKTLVVEAVSPTGSTAPELFIAGEQGYMFGAPQRVADDEKVLFAVPVLQRPESRPANGALHYTLTTSAGAVEGTLPFP